jgi:hypothetical protein
MADLRSTSRNREAGSSVSSQWTSSTINGQGDQASVDQLRVADDKIGHRNSPIVLPAAARIAPKRNAPPLATTGVRTSTGAAQAGP